LGGEKTKKLSEKEFADAIERAHTPGHPPGPGEVKPHIETSEERADRLRKRR